MFGVVDDTTTTEFVNRACPVHGISLPVVVVVLKFPTDSFLNAFYRMVNRRGLPREMLSNSGTNFVAADRELRELVEALDQSKIAQSTANNGVMWHFNPPLVPHFGGVNETMIKAAKRAANADLAMQT